MPSRATTTSLKTPCFLSARRASSSSSALSSTRRMILSLISPRKSSPETRPRGAPRATHRGAEGRGEVPRQASSPLGSGSEDSPGAAFYPVCDKGVAVVHTLVDLVGRVAPVRQGYQGEQERQRHEHYGHYAERYDGHD